MKRGSTQCFIPFGTTQTHLANEDFHPTADGRQEQARRFEATRKALYEAPPPHSAGISYRFHAVFFATRSYSVRAR